MQLQCCRDTRERNYNCFVAQGADAAAITADKNNKQSIFRNCVPFSDCIREINNMQVENPKDLDVVM